MQKTVEEIQAMTPKEHKAYLLEQQKVVFGDDHKVDKDGNPIEQGIGSLAQPTDNSVAAYRRWGRDEPDYAANLARMEKELAAYKAKQRTARS
jgi:hypothetical protein